MNRNAARILSIVLLAVFVLAGAAVADRLEMKDGRVIHGKYISGSRVNIHFRVDGETKIYKVSEVSALFFEDEAADAAPAPAAKAAPGSSAAEAAPAASAGTIPAGTRLMVRMIDGVDSEKNSVGDTFRASLEENLSVDGVIVVPRGADVIGHLTEVKEAGRIKGKSELRLELKEVLVDGVSYPVVTGEYELSGKSRGADTAKKVGGGAAIGAVIGAIAGGGKGAAIGAGVGAGAGTAIQIFTKGEQVRVPSETVLEFTLESDLVVKSASSPRRKQK